MDNDSSMTFYFYTTDEKYWKNAAYYFGEEAISGDQNPNGKVIQLEKIDMLDFADVIALNKFDKRGSLDALRDVKKQVQRNHQRCGAFRHRHQYR